MSDWMEYSPDPAWEAYCIENNIGGRGEPDLYEPRNSISTVSLLYETEQRLIEAVTRQERITLSPSAASDVARELSRLRDELKWWKDRRP